MRNNGHVPMVALVVVTSHDADIMGAAEANLQSLRTRENLSSRQQLNVASSLLVSTTISSIETACEMLEMSQATTAVVSALC